jgi:tetratricopeptide (TPR) repeat protein
MSEDAGSELWNAEARRLEGWIYLEKRDTERSRSSFEKGIRAVKEHESDFVPAQLSYSLWTPDRIPRLLACYTFALGLVDIAEGKPDSARARLEEMGDLLPNYARLLHGEILLAEGSFEKAITVCEKCSPWSIPYMSDTDSMLSYNLPPYKDVLARAFLAKGDLAQAQEAYERLARFDPRGKGRQLIHPKYHRNLAQVYRQTGNQAGAQEQIRKFRELWKAGD